MSENRRSDTGQQSEADSAIVSAQADGANATRTTGPVTLSDLLRVLSENPPDSVVASLCALVEDLDPDGSARDRDLLSRFSPHLTMYAKNHREVLSGFREAFRNSESTAVQVMSMSPVRNAGVRGALDGVMDDFFDIYLRSDSDYLQQLLLQNCGSLRDSETALDLICQELDKAGNERTRGVELSLASFETLLQTEDRLRTARHRLRDGLDHPLVRAYPTMRDLPRSLSKISQRLIDRCARRDLSEVDLAKVAAWIKRRDPDRVELLVKALAPATEEERTALRRAGIKTP